MHAQIHTCAHPDTHTYVHKHTHAVHIHARVQLRRETAMNVKISWKLINWQQGIHQKDLKRT